MKIRRRIMYVLSETPAEALCVALALIVDLLIIP
jgi:hypothetical protein